LDCATKTHSLCPYHRAGMVNIAGLGYLEIWLDVQLKFTASVYTTETHSGMVNIAGLGYLDVWLDCATKTN
jgi:GH15 family glucan-1,4-alpha-glucosidase